ncbi:hypothetical protein [Streptomyces sp. NPDC059247]|uniref:hypothetical protein n=1 Tax=Streptomyces sp. NPDC059247 TaxID=3346790 RepID=UPI00369462B5
MALPDRDRTQPATPLTRDLNAAVVVPDPSTDAEASFASRGLVAALPGEGRGGEFAPAWSCRTAAGFFWWGGTTAR